MGVIKQGILGGFSGKVGNVTGTSWKGRAVMKARPLSVANPRTAGQVTNRSAFKLCTQFASIILASLIIPLMNRFADAVSGYNYFVSRNKQNFDENGIAIQADINFGTGKLGDTPIVSCTIDASDQNVTITWAGGNSNAYKLATDKAYILVIDSTTDEVAFMGTQGVERATETLTDAFNFITIVAGRTYWVYLVFLRADGTQVGNTAFVTEVAQA